MLHYTQLEQEPATLEQGGAPPPKGEWLGLACAWAWWLQPAGGCRSLSRLRVLSLSNAC